MSKPTREQAEQAVKTLIEWAGDNPDREGLVETPKRVVKAYEQFFEGYDLDPEEILTKTFEEVEGYDEMVIVKDIRLESHCEHHIVPILGKAHIGYIPNNRVVGISKLARIVDVFGKRLQTQETMTSQIANVIQKVLDPKGVAVVIDASHQCLTTRGVDKAESSTVTSVAPTFIAVAKIISFRSFSEIGPELKELMKIAPSAGSSTIPAPSISNRHCFRSPAYLIRSSFSHKLTWRKLAAETLSSSRWYAFFISCLAFKPSNFDPESSRSKLIVSSTTITMPISL